MLERKRETERKRVGERDRKRGREKTIEAQRKGTVALHRGCETKNN